MWCASCHYLLFRALRDADEEFGAVVRFRHDFKRSLCGRIAFSPAPGQKNPIVSENGVPCIPLFPKWNTSNTCVGLIGSRTSHQGLKMCDLTFQELKFSQSLAFKRALSSTLMIRHYLQQPFQRVTVKKSVPPKSVSCPACVRNGEGHHGRGRPPRHSCDDTCLMCEVHNFSDPEFCLSRNALPAASLSRCELVATVCGA